MNSVLSVKGLAILVSIPVVGLALWVDYFGKSLQALVKEDPLYDRSTELSKIKIATWIGILFQSVLFIATAELRDQAPWSAYGLFLLAFLIQNRIQVHAETQVKGPHDPSVKTEAFTRKPRNVLEQNGLGNYEPGRAVRSFVWALLGGALYILGFATPVVIASLTTRLFHLNPTSAAVVVILSAVLGMIFGLVINFALAPFYLRQMLTVKTIEQESRHRLLSQCFEQANIPTPSLWIVESAPSEAIAMIAGFSRAKSWFKPGLFLSRGLLDLLNEQELHAVVLHEVAHLSLNHLRRRLTYSGLLLVGTTTVATTLIFIANLWAPQGELRNWVGMIAASLAFFSAFRLLGTQSRQHETEADVFCVERLGADVTAFTSALRKLDKTNSGNPFAAVSGLTHPATERRIALLNSRFSQKNKQDKAA
ncbi:M48 family metallopeptidase [Bdellovibrionota bacterium FG-1]